MRFYKNSEYIIWFLVSSFGLGAVTCYPTGKPDQVAESELNEEKRFPNGTIIGRYSYTDKDGNPIQVKYFADDASYGVELKSLKIMDSTMPSTPEFFKDDNLAKATDKVIGKSDLSAGIFKSMDSISKGKARYPFEYLNQNNRYKNEKASPDFDIYYQNELKGPEKCGKEKVHVYFDKERKIRNALDTFEADKYCEQF